MSEKADSELTIRLLSTHFRLSSVEYVLDLTQLTTIFSLTSFLILIIWFYGFTDGWRCALGDEKNPKAG
jgi:hypothetical protein